MVVSYRVEGNEFRADRPRPWADLRVMTRGGGQRSFALHPDGERIAATLVPAAAEAPRDRVMLIVHFFDELRRAVPAPAR
jgi:hypothetical protein